MNSQAFSVHLIRHAESENNARPVHERVCDPRITQRGHLQTQYLADWMKTLRLELLITSPFQRTLQTAQGILRARGRRTEVWHDIFESGGCYHGHHESNFAGAPGLNRDQIVQFFGTPSVADSSDDWLVIDSQIGVDGWWGGRPREALEQTRERAIQVNERLIRTFAGTGGSVALVVHADFKRELLQLMLSDILDLDAVGPIANTSVTELQYSGSPDHGRWRLGYLNSVTHLPPRLITGREW
ncbi:histidine phosphatase family protein [Neorhodopirellula pilleata]|uniref:Bifunctional RNase H/acid phosphatase n=1 Tax=Neorhodopirellula pilleata TaxID=2714738 RepID=A0A5C5ZZ25_9BACT|nr:histidine phosphatase family protein [Neorhodopirellula pilleata]TWT92287.1 bifunctional RNase H/acid phosphatase [Neorhodopirellula pilleata]